MINGIEYTPAAPTGNRKVVVVDRGWIFAGDVALTDDGSLLLTRAVWVFRWERIGFAAMLANPKAPGVDIRPMSVPVSIPSGSLIFACPVEDTWGM